MADPEDDGVDRDAILARRRRFMAVALTGLAGTTLAATACPCLKVAPPPDEPDPKPPDTDGDQETDSDSEGEADDAPPDEHQDDGDPPELAQPGQ